MARATLAFLGEGANFGAKSAILGLGANDKKRGHLPEGGMMNRVKYTMGLSTTRGEKMPY